MKSKWYLIFTKPNCEKRVVAQLTKRKIENFSPLNRIVKYDRNKKRISLKPLFPSFVFVYISDVEIGKIRKIGGVINFIYWLGKPVIIPEDVIEKLLYFTTKYNNLSLFKIDINTCGIVELIIDHPFESNANNGMIPIKNSTHKLMIPTLGYVVMAQQEKTIAEVFSFKNVEMAM